MPLNTLPSEWKLPVNLTVIFHIFILFCAMVLPGLLHQRPKLLEVTTIDLVNLDEPAGPAAAKQETAPTASAKPAAVIKPETTKQVAPPVEKAIPIPEPKEPALPPEPVAPPTPVEAISLKPLKQKVKKEVKEIPEPKLEDIKYRKDLIKNITKELQEEAKKEATAQETIKQQRQLAAARETARRLDLEARMAEADAKAAAEDARNALRDQIRNARSSPGGAGSGGGQNVGVLEQQYYATIMGHIQQFWQPPDVKNWEPNLLAQVSITIASDGKIVGQSFEQNSGDKLFDQFVVKTLEAANPLPPPPPALQKQRLEVGLRFKPSGMSGIQ
jgi:protein TonB